MADLQALKVKRGVLKSNITRFNTFLTREPINIYEIKERLVKVEDSYEEFITVQAQIELLDPDINGEPEREAFEDLYFGAKAKGKRLVDTLSQSIVQTNVIGSPIHSQSSVNLPKIQLPKFNGKTDDWIPFREIFEALIHSDMSLSEIQKLFYLRSSLCGEALEVIESLELSAANYEVAWSLIKNRFQNEYLISQNHVAALFNLEKVNKESSIALRKLLDVSLKHIRALKALGHKIEHWDLLLIHIITSKLDNITHKEWMASIGSNTNPKFSELESFLSTKCQILESVSININDTSKMVEQKNKTTFNSSSKHKGSFNYVSQINYQCPVCMQNHKIFQCDKFLKLTGQERLAQAKELKLCTNCLRSNHKKSECRLNSSCLKCRKFHNTLLHMDSNQNQSSNNSQGIQQTNTNAKASNIQEAQSVNANAIVSKTLLHSGINNNNCAQIILSTALIKVQHPTKDYTITCRALLDSGSQSNFMTERVSNLLRLNKQPIKLSLSGINQNVSVVQNKAHAIINSTVNSFTKPLDFLVLKQITGTLPSINLDLKKWKLPKNITLADKNFHKSGEVDVLLGAEIFWDLLCVGQFRPTINQPLLQKTVLGWIVAGMVPNSVPFEKSLIHLSTIEDIDNTLKKFWEVENYDNDKPLLSDEQQLSEELYCKTTKVLNGNFMVKMPIQGDLQCLSGSREIAAKRFELLEKKLRKNEELRLQYNEFMKEYLELNHMELVPKEELLTDKFTYYIPHHPVIKSDSLTTKLRIVFDASCKTSSGKSLNDLMLSGPVVQDQLVAIIIRFRKHPIVICADIEKMYRQILIDNSQVDLQRILWRFNANDNLNEYRLLTVTYGTKAAPYLATRTINEIAKRSKDHYPLAAKAIEKDFYVDDLMTGGNTVEEVSVLQSQIKEILSSYGFNLRKWSSNSAQLVNVLENQTNEEHIIYSVDSDNSIKTLGLRWNPLNDTFSYKLKQPEIKEGHVTKRSILSQVGQIFDPLGLISPVIVKTKILLQDLWQLKLSWDESVPASVYTEWKQFKESLHCLNNLHINRRLHNFVHVEKTELHAFSDASLKAYGAAVYLRTVDCKGNVCVELVYAKSRVAPIKTISIPRLELCAGLIMAEITKYCLEALEYKSVETYYWTDSTILLYWLDAPANKWSTFVSNRVAKIQTLTDVSKWRYVKSEENPADIVSRGIHANQIESQTIWWHGPLWLSESIEFWTKPTKFDLTVDEEQTEERKQNKISLLIQLEFDLINKCSDLCKLIRITSYCFRFYNLLKAKRDKTGQTKVQTGKLTAIENQQSTYTLIKLIQNQTFGEELEALTTNKELPRASKLKPLNPFIDKFGLIRVGGRLRWANIPYNHKFPIVLPHNNHFTDLIARHFHVRNLHAGQQSLLAAIRLEYWPIRGKNLVKRIINSCKVCARAKPPEINQIMGDLPRDRVQPLRPFVNTGVDFAGPLYLSHGRGRTLTKAYVSVFVCLATKAIHLELVGDLSSNAFLGALRRFISRRGDCLKLYSDNATNFVGAYKELKELHQLFKREAHQKSLQEFLSKENISWHFIPPYSPHVGGIWESAVKSFKYHLTRIMGNAHLTYEELYTLLTQIEACLNSRPLFPLSNDPNDLNFLSPSHFLIGDVLTNKLEPDLKEVKMSSLTRWQRIQKLLHHFWCRWTGEYLSSLQQRSKWCQGKPNVVPGMLVLLKEDNLPPLRWRLGRISQVHPGADGKVRIITVKTTVGESKRAVTRVCPLMPAED